MLGAGVIFPGKGNSICEGAGAGKGLTFQELKISSGWCGMGWGSGRG